MSIEVQRRPADVTLDAAQLRPESRDVARDAITIAAPALALAIMGYRHRWVTEDAFISLRVVEQLLAGNGPVFNTGERVEAYTHPLWVALLTIWGALGGRLEYGAVALGIVFSVLGLVCAQLGAMRLWRRCSTGSANVTVPAGALAFVAVPVVWDYVTSGLETGLAFGWLGVAFWLLARQCLDDHRAGSWRGDTLAAITFGAGVLVRPDLAVFSATFLLALLLARARGEGQRARVWGSVRLVGTAAAIPLLYQIFRMGYFAALVPNTAFAKEASAAHWSQGWRYLTDFTNTYWLWLPVGFALLTSGWLATRALRRADLPLVVVVAAPVAGALLHTLYVVRVGGDFMHGRLLLPSLFGFLLPVAVLQLPLPGTRQRRAGVVWAFVAVTLVWATIAATSLRVSYPAGISAAGIGDEHGIFVDNSGKAHPVTLDDYRGMRQEWPRVAAEWRALAETSARVLVVDAVNYPLDPAVDDAQVVVAYWNVGVAGSVAGLEVQLVDRLGLTDPIASRLAVDVRGRPGHEKRLAPVWAIARFAAPSANDPPDVLAARAALTCGELRELLTAVDEPLGLDRFMTNLWRSVQLHDLRIDPDPIAARAELCE